MFLWKTMLILYIFLFCCVGVVSNTAVEELPSWHMKPIGSHIEPSKVDETFSDDSISPKDFAEKYVLPRKPLVFRNVVKEWPAFELWTDQYLIEKYGEMELRLEGKKEKSSGIPKGDVCLGRDRMKTFLSQYQQGVDKYVVSELPTPMWGDVKIPASLSCGEFVKNFVEIDIWMNSDLGKKGNGGNSIIHKDAYNTLNCVLNGSKEWKLFELKYNDFLYQSWEGPLDAGYGGFSLVNPDKVDAKRFPDVGKISQWQFTTINAGDCLYLPSQLWHQVRSYGVVNRAVAFLFSQFNGQKSINTSDCPPKPDPVSLSDVDVDLQYPGSGPMSMGNSELSEVLEQLKKYAVSKKKRYITKKHIYNLIYNMHEHTPKRKELLVEKTKSMYNYFLQLAGGNQENMTQAFVDSLTREQVRPVYKWLFPMEPANFYEHEYAYFQPEELQEEVQNLLQSSKGVLKKGVFIEAYTKIGGTTRFAEEFWENLAGSLDTSEVSGDVVTTTLPKALEKYDLYRREDPEEREAFDDDSIIVTPQGHVSQPKSNSRGVYESQGTSEGGEEILSKTKEEL